MLHGSMRRTTVLSAYPTIRKTFIRRTAERTFFQVKTLLCFVNRRERSSHDKLCLLMYLLFTDRDEEIMALGSFVRRKQPGKRECSFSLSLVSRIRADLQGCIRPLPIGRTSTLFSMSRRTTDISYTIRITNAWNSCSSPVPDPGFKRMRRMRKIQTGGWRTRIRLKTVWGWPADGICHLVVYLRLVQAINQYFMRYFQHQFFLLFLVAYKRFYKFLYSSVLCPHTLGFRILSNAARSSTIHDNWIISNGNGIKRIPISTYRMYNPKRLPTRRSASQN